MIFNKPKFWDEKPSLLAALLYPLSLITNLIIFFKKIIIKKIEFNIPIICVGNIYVGGTGKTPLSILLAKEILKLKKKPVILRKYYKSHADEHKLIKKEINNLILCNDRIEGIHRAEKLNFNSVILDDGFQDYKIKKNLSIICFHQTQLIGNGFVIPAGPLREGLETLKKANIILINGDRSKNFENKLLNINKKLKFFYAYYKPKNLNQFKNKRLLALSGIGNPENFFNLLKKYKLKIKDKLVFPDHYIFSKNQILNIKKKAKEKNLKIIMTEKDFFKIKRFNIKKLDYLRVALEIKEKKKFINEIKKIYDKTY